ncbi:hypothetical protein AB0L65_25815 [Nonomuraea sp. NPDC052116]|uniref:hypothetical protein n=1 Tax=Nonomuraea sp. NPDC052116 TaxID=3155665 RepID=UPI00342CA052
MFGRYLRSQLVVLLCGGLVGPIFVIVYLALGPAERAEIQWMFYVGLVLTVSDVVVAVALARRGAKAAARTAALERSGVLTLAQITGMSETGTRINDRRPAPPRRPSGPPPSVWRSWRRSARRGRSRTTSTPPSAGRSSPRSECGYFDR